MQIGVRAHLNGIAWSSEFRTVVQRLVIFCTLVVAHSNWVNLHHHFFELDAKFLTENGKLSRLHRILSQVMSFFIQLLSDIVLILCKNSGTKPWKLKRWTYLWIFLISAQLPFVHGIFWVRMYCIAMQLNWSRSSWENNNSSCSCGWGSSTDVLISLVAHRASTGLRIFPALYRVTLRHLCWIS